jgi:hypothetical protein
LPRETEEGQLLRYRRRDAENAKPMKTIFISTANNEWQTYDKSLKTCYVVVQNRLYRRKPAIIFCPRLLTTVAVRKSQLFEPLPMPLWPPSAAPTKPSDVAEDRPVAAHAGLHLHVHVLELLSICTSTRTRLAGSSQGHQQ